MRRSRGWSTRGTQAVIETPSARAVSHTIIGAITAYGVLNVSLRDTGNAKKRKVDGAKKRKATDAAVKAILRELQLDIMFSLLVTQWISWMSMTT